MKHSDEAKQKISVAQKGRKHQAHEGFQKGHPDLGGEATRFGPGNKANLGKKWSEEYKATRMGENHPLWRGGNTHKRICRIIFEKYDYTCQVCGERDPDVLEIDHRLSRALYPDLTFDLNNLWVLCANCHRRKTKRDWEEIKKSRS